MRSLATLCRYALLVLALPALPATAHPPLALAGSRVRFASAAEASEILGARDEYVLAMSPFDRSYALRSATPVDEERFLAFARAQARDWSEPEQASMASALAELDPLLARYDLRLPSEIVLAKTTGREGSWALYRRGQALFFSERIVATAGGALRQILAAQLWHLVGARDSTLRAEAARLWGFEPCAEVPLPPGLAERVIGSPSAPRRTLALELRPGVWVQPIRVADRMPDGTDADPRGDYPFRLLVLERSGDALRPKLQGGAPELLDPRLQRDYLNRLGRNTDEIYDLETVQGENFAIAVLGIRAVRPELPEALAGLLRRHE